jgi:hypothetical protein
MTVPIKDPEFSLINLQTGEEIPLDTLMSSDKAERWDKVYTKNLARMLDMIGDEKMRVISYLLRKKDGLNQISATMREIAESTKVSTNTVNKVMKAMQAGDYIHKIRGGKWRLSPRLICGGKTSIAMATINYYDNVDKK